MNGYSGSYGINGSDFTLPPTEGQWEPKEVLGRDGQGRPIYSALGEFTLSWGLLSISEFKQLNDFYLFVSNTGTAVCDLPKWGNADYLFYSYSGTILNRPTVGAYYEESVTDVKMTISGIRVS